METGVLTRQTEHKFRFRIFNKINLNFSLSLEPSQINQLASLNLVTSLENNPCAISVISYRRISETPRPAPLPPPRHNFFYFFIFYYG